MPLQVSTDAGRRPSPQIVAANIVTNHARSTGHPRASEAVAVTVPRCRVNQSGLQYEQRRTRAGIQFRFQTGTLALSLLQDIYIANNISSCAQDIWAEHEQEHIRDNQQVMNRMERRIRAHRRLQNILINPQWHPSRNFNRIQDTIQDSVGEVFRSLTADAVRIRDTNAAYNSVHARIRRQCGP